MHPESWPELGGGEKQKGKVGDERLISANQPPSFKFQIPSKKVAVAVEQPLETPIPRMEDGAKAEVRRKVMHSTLGPVIYATNFAHLRNF